MKYHAPMRALLLFLLAAPAAAHDPLPAAFAEARQAVEESRGDDAEFKEGFSPTGCAQPSAAQRALVARGNALKGDFLRECAASGADALWCGQSLRPNPASRPVFACTYGENQPHQLIDPDRSTWVNVFKALALASELSRQGVGVCQINNWWRPEPYNANVGGAPGRHPAGTSVDVKFCSPADQEKAFLALCRLRRQGRLRALGYYPGSTVLHLGVGDKSGNTWGKACP